MEKYLLPFSKGLSFQVIVITVALVILVLLVVAFSVYGKESINKILEEILRLLGVGG